MRQGLRVQQDQQVQRVRLVLWVRLVRLARLGLLARLQLFRLARLRPDLRVARLQSRILVRPLRRSLTSPFRLVRPALRVRLGLQVLPVLLQLFPALRVLRVQVVLPDLLVRLVLRGLWVLPARLVLRVLPVLRVHFLRTCCVM